MIKHKKGPRRRQAAWTAPSVAKHIGRDWKTMSAADRKLLSEACRFFYNQHTRMESHRLHDRLAARETSLSVDTPEESS